MRVKVTTTNRAKRGLDTRRILIRQSYWPKQTEKCTMYHVPLYPASVMLSDCIIGRESDMHRWQGRDGEREYRERERGCECGCVFVQAGSSSYRWIHHTWNSMLERFRVRPRATPSESSIPIQSSLLPLHRHYFDYSIVSSVVFAFADIVLVCRHAVMHMRSVHFW